MTPDVSWDALRVYIAVVRAGSISAAADELGMAQSSVSEQIARLERDLGYRLLHRHSTGVRPNQRGAELAARVSAPVDALAAVTTTRDHDAAARTVVLGGPAEFLSEVILPSLVGELPDRLSVSARFGLAENLLDGLRAGALDVLVSSVPTRGPDLASEPIYDEQFVLVAHPRWAAAAASDIDAVPVLAYGPELPIIRRYWRSVFGRPPTDLVVRALVPDLRSLARLVEAGAGMSVLPEYLVSEQLDTGVLVRLHTPQVAPLNTLVVTTRRTPAKAEQDVMTVRDAVIAAARRALA